NGGMRRYGCVSCSPSELIEHGSDRILVHVAHGEHALVGFHAAIVLTRVPLREDGWIAGDIHAVTQHGLLYFARKTRPHGKYLVVLPYGEAGLDPWSKHFTFQAFACRRLAHVLRCALGHPPLAIGAIAPHPFARLDEREFEKWHGDPVHER